MTFLSKIKKAKKLIKEQIEKYPDKVAVACSFGKDSMVLYHLAKSVKKDIPVISVMTPFKFPVTYKYKDKMVEKYRMNIHAVMREERTDMLEWWKSNPDECCKYYKVEPMGELLQNYDCWLAGLRRSEGNSRAEIGYVVNDRYGKVKVNPILDFTETDIWRYLAMNRIPVNPMYKKGYRSLGCKHCSRPEKDEKETERAGRWVGTSKCGLECGIHSLPKQENDSNSQNNIIPTV